MADYETRSDAERVVRRPHWRDLPKSDSENWRKQFRSMYEYMLLVQARDGDEVCASKLLLIFERDGIFQNEEVQEAVMAGVRAVSGYAARAALGPPAGRSQKINVRKFFEGVNAEGRRGRKADHDERYDALVVYDNALTPADAVKALSASKPVKIHHAERILVKHIQRANKDISPEVCVACIRFAFPEIDWSNGEGDFFMPVGWAAIRTE